MCSFGHCSRGMSPCLTVFDRRISGGSKGGREGRTPPPPLGVQILSISCSFWENSAKLCVHAPPLGGFTPPPLGKSWIRHCNKGRPARILAQMTGGVMAGRTAGIIPTNLVVVIVLRGWTNQCLTGHLFWSLFQG